MQYGEFLGYVDEFLNKSEMTPRIPRFVNTAKLRLQRRHDFNFTRVDEQSTYPATAGSGISLPQAFKSLTGEHSVRLLIGSGEFPLVVSKLETERRRREQTVFGTLKDGVVIAPVDMSTNSARQVRAYIQILAAGNKLWAFPEQLNQIVKYEYYSWLADYSDSATEDFLLLRGHDMLLWETIKVANMYLNEEDRVAINAELAEQAFQEFCEFDNQQSLTGSSIETS